MLTHDHCKAHANAAQASLIALSAVTGHRSRTYCPICNANRRSLMEFEIVLVLDVVELHCVFCGGRLEQHRIEPKELT